MIMKRDDYSFTFLVGIFSVVLALIPARSATADVGAPPSPAPAAPAQDQAADKHEVALKSLRSEAGPIRLMGKENNAQVSFPLSTRQQLSNVELALYVTNSIALDSRSHMAIAVNGVVIGQIPFRAQNPENHARITIPPELLQPGYNQISFTVAQLSTQSCEEQSSPDLWSEIDTTRSKISYVVKPQAIKPSLAELPLLMDKRIVGDYTLTIATAGEPKDNTIEAGGYVAQAAALSRDYASLAIKHVRLPAPARGAAVKNSIAALPEDLFEGDGVLLGTRDELAPWLDKETRVMAAEPLLAIFPFGSQGERFVLVVTGADNAQVRQAAQTLVQAYTTLPPTAKANIKEMSTAGINPRPTLQPGVRYAFSDFNFHTATRQGIYPQGMNVRFWVPADRFAYPNSKLDLSLHLAYGAGFGAQSVLNVFLNDHFEHAVRLSEPAGAVYYNYEFPIPISSLVPGWNELQFRPSLIPLRAEGLCQPIYTENLLLTLFDDSYMESADMQQLTQLPDLSLFGRTGFPFAGGREETPVQLALTGHESGTIEAAWTMLGKLAQVNDGPIMHIRTVAPDKVDGNALLVGQLDKVPVSLLKHSTLSRHGWWRLGGAQASAAESSDSKSKNDPALNVSLGNLLDHSILVTEFESPDHAGHSVVMVVSNKEDLLSRQVTALIDAPYWGQLTGGTVVLTADSDKVRNYEPLDSYMVGDAGLRARASHIFTQHKWIGIALVALCIFLFTLITWRVLVIYRRREHEARFG